MKFKFIKEVDGQVNSYGWLVKTGDVAELDGHLANKAQNNPAWEEVDGRTKVTAVKMKQAPKEMAEQFEIENQRLREVNAKLEAENKRLTHENRQLKLTR